MEYLNPQHLQTLVNYDDVVEKFKLIKPNLKQRLK